MAKMKDADVNALIPPSTFTWWRWLPEFSEARQYVLEKTVMPYISRASRGLLQLSQADLADAANISRRTLIALETGKREPDITTCIALKAALISRGILVDIIDNKLIIGMALPTIDESTKSFIEAQMISNIEKTALKIRNDLDALMSMATASRKNDQTK
ncbi:helix-turn-helix transcriptional regulator [Rhodoblastus sp. 17X3]|uniref:helix-turn-helix transcriptional regulator n=1 Tax=Rhodoblastus sp. 17X3 TaxID=3047026 RepID=UPI0024B66F48|nr:helix-turn-helix transcriptional regulator [Rhodoblastus sp. 17X3]MDI9847627.1 helix-turn-helix transcriptional regulator [Rhodoblastus sp. 17X3]